MESNTQHKNLHRPQNSNDNCNGPRVSFNKDVHVKRIGNRPNENLHFGLSGSESSLPPYKRELPQDLSEEELIKEAEKVLAQSERIKCTADTPNTIAGVRLQEKLLEDRKFSSLPHRRKKSKPLNRSVSDASQKKTKRPSIFNIFSKRSDPSLNTSTNPTSTINGEKGILAPAIVINKQIRKPVGRSKSDVGYQSSETSPNDRSFSGQSLTLDRKRNKNTENDESMTKPKKKSQLSPIIENPPGEKYFGFTPDERNLLRSTKSEDRTIKPLTKTNNTINSYNDLERMLDNEPQTMSKTIPKHSQSLESLHSSQLPQDKLPLTKGVMVDGMVKRLSMERFSPPPTFNSPAFSYTRPTNESIVYAQVQRDENGEKSSKHPHPNELSIPLKMDNFKMNKDGHRTISPYKETSGIDTVDYKNSFQRDVSPNRHHIENNFRHNKFDSYRNSPVPRKTEPHREKYHESPVLMQRHRIAVTPTRNYSDEDEGIGFESRKRYHDDDMIPSRDIRQSSCEPPIIPNLRPSYGSAERDEHLIDLANRRKLLESKIHERTFGTPKEHIADKYLLSPRRHYSPTRRDYENEPIRRYDDHGPEKMKSLSPNRKQWSKQPKYYPETNIDDDFCRDNDVIRREQERQRHKHYIENEYRNISPPNRVIDLGYIDQYNNTNLNNNNNINYKFSKQSGLERSKARNHLAEDIDVDRYPNQFSTLEREKQKYRSFDKGDSGIENDIKRERDTTHHRDEFESKSQNHNIANDSIKSVTELFLKRERQHTELIHPSKKRYDFVFRERSIDDGSHFDPRLDKYPHKDQRSRSALNRPSPEVVAKKSEKKFGSLKKMKEMFLPSKKKHPSNGEKEKSTPPKEIITHQTLSETPPPLPVHPEIRRIDIATRRRLSTPKASPLPKRNLSQKSSKLSHASSHRSSDVSASPPQKSGWFKSLERLSRKHKTEKIPENKKTSSITVKRSNTTSVTRPTITRQSPSPVLRHPPPQANLRFFGDTDLESVNASISKATTNSRLRKPLNQNISQSAHNLNQSGVPKKTFSGSQPNVHTSSTQQINKKFRSKYLPDLSESTSENENITSHTKHQTSTVHHSTPNQKYKQRRQYHSTEYLENNQRRPERMDSVPYKHHVIENSSPHSSQFNLRDDKSSLARSRDKLHRSTLREQNGRASSETRHLPPTGPQKPAREFDRRRALSNDRFLESSGTEGESSQQSVVYLHATTVGHIPQPYVLNSRRSSKSRDELSSIKTKSSMNPQPMTRTVSRSVSMLAPWTPKHLSDGYEINYSQTMQNNKKKSAESPRKESTRKARSRDDLSSIRNSSITSATTASKHKK